MAVAAAMSQAIATVRELRIVVVSDVQQAEAQLARAPQLLVVDVSLGSAACVGLVRRGRRITPAPTILLTGESADPQLVANLVWEGADAFASQPLAGTAVEGALLRGADARALCERVAAYLVGRVKLKEAQQMIRGEMNGEALRRTRGSRRGAATLLGVDRRYVQLLIQELGEPELQTTATHSITNR